MDEPTLHRFDIVCLVYNEIQQLGEGGAAVRARPRCSVRYSQFARRPLSSCGGNNEKTSID